MDPDHELVKAIRYKVIVDYPAPENRFDSIQVNFKEVVYQAMDYLRQNGRKKIGFIGGEDHLTRLVDGKKLPCKDIRLASYEDYCREKAMDSSENVWITEWFEPEEGYQLTKKAIESGTSTRMPSFMHQMSWLSVATVPLVRVGIQVGKDISIVSIDNLPYASYLTPPLTTVALNMALLGRTAAMALDSQIRGRDYPLTFFTPVELIKRESCVKKA